MRKTHGAPPMAALLMALLLSGCGDSDVREVRSWMDQVKRDTRPKVKPLPASKEFIPYAYHQQDTVDPFSTAKLADAGLLAQARNTLQPDLERPREALEAYPLDTMTMVGTMQKGGTSFALLRIENVIYRVRAGQRLGQNFGQVTRVTPAAVDIREMVQDAGGDWVERISKLELQESKEMGK